MEEVLLNTRQRNQRKNSVFILNIYSNPRDPRQQFQAILKKSVDLAGTHPLVVVGDLNAPSGLWGYVYNTSKGRDLWQTANEMDLTLITDKAFPTHISNSVCRDTTPDLAFVKNFEGAEWSNTAMDFGSDHYVLETCFEVARSKSREFLITDWDHFRKLRWNESKPAPKHLEDWCERIKSDNKMKVVREDHGPSSDRRQYVFSATPDMSGTTCDEAGRGPGPPAASVNTSRRSSLQVRRELRRARHRSQMKVVVLTIACLAWNATTMFATPSDSLFSRLLGVPTPSHHWSMKALLDFAHASNALSDLGLVYSIYYYPGVDKDFDVVPQVSNITTAIGFTGIAALKVLLIVYVYVAYVHCMEENASSIAPEVVAASRPETNASLVEDVSTRTRIFGRRKKSRSSVTQSCAAPLPSKHGHATSSPSVHRSGISSDAAIQPAAVPLADGLEPTIQMTHSAYNDASEEAPLNVVPNKNTIAYFWGQGGSCETKILAQPAELSPSRRTSRGFASFDAIHMMLFGGRPKSRRGPDSAPPRVKKEEKNTGDPGTSTEAAKPSTSAKAGEPSLLNESGSKELRNECQQDAVVDEPLREPVPDARGSGSRKNPGTKVAAPTSDQSIPRDTEATVTNVMSPDTNDEKALESKQAREAVAHNKVPVVKPALDQSLQSIQAAQQATTNGSGAPTLGQLLQSVQAAQQAATTGPEAIEHCGVDTNRSSPQGSLNQQTTGVEPPEKCDERSQPTPK
ncbi:hypothetical protein HPB50_003466 [Hyalomma asiaticum]|uniref:Uncharacterized protein n=1 Tax=Hyalomma asiaticum TaxID=266040 RepID=A0ACB7S058_HYAAI|nr:hypothetical protein HPB50_003466 [Hyalomma asiaticum]